MDCNNYSYMQAGGENVVIASSEDGKMPHFESCVNFFGDRYYYVCELLGDFAEEYPFTNEGYCAAFTDYMKRIEA